MDRENWAQLEEYTNIGANVRVPTMYVRIVRRKWT